VDQFLNLQTLIEVMLAISLSAASGFRVFVPLLVASLGAVVGHLDLPTEFDWMESPQAAIVLAIATALEIGGYYIPWFDHALDVVATPAAILVGTLMTQAIAPDMNPIAQWTLALVAGGGTAGLTKGMMNILRAASTAISGGLTNPVVATIELAIAIGLSVLALTVPVIAGIVTVTLLVGAASKVAQLVNRFKSQRVPESQ
jgi:Domain of unknown function (DUF4126)